VGHPGEGACLYDEARVAVPGSCPSFCSIARYVLSKDRAICSFLSVGVPEVGPFLDIPPYISTASSNADRLAAGVRRLPSRSLFGNHRGRWSGLSWSKSSALSTFA